MSSIPLTHRLISSPLLIFFVKKEYRGVIIDKINSPIKSCLNFKDKENAEIIPSDKFEAMVRSTNVLIKPAIEPRKIGNKSLNVRADLALKTFTVGIKRR